MNAEETKIANSALSIVGLTVSSPIVVISTTVVAVVAVALSILKALGFDTEKISYEIARKFGKREQRFAPEDLIKMMDAEYMTLVGRHISKEELAQYYDILLYGYFDFNELRRDIKNTKEYKTIQAVPVIKNIYRSVTGNDPDVNTLTAWTVKWVEGWSEEQIRREIAWQAIKQTQAELLGREPTEARPEDNYWYNLLISGTQPLWAIRKGIMNSTEYQLKHPSQVKKALPYVVGAGIVMSLL